MNCRDKELLSAFALGLSEDVDRPEIERLLATDEGRRVFDEVRMLSSFLKSEAPVIWAKTPAIADEPSEPSLASNLNGLARSQDTLPAPRERPSGPRGRSISARMLRFPATRPFQLMRSTLHMLVHDRRVRRGFAIPAVVCAAAFVGFSAIDRLGPNPPDSKSSIEPLTVFAISGGDQQVYGFELTGAGDAVTNQFYLLAPGTIREVKTATTKTGQRLLVGISAENGRPHALKLDAQGHAVAGWYTIGEGKATAICLGEDAAGGLLVFAVSDPNKKAYVIRLGDDGQAVGGFALLAEGEVTMLKYFHTKTGQRLLFCVSAENGRPHALKLDAQGHAVAGWYTIGEGKAKTISLASTESGSPLLFAISGGDDRVYAIKLDTGGTPIGGFYRLGDGTAVGIGNNHSYCFGVNVGVPYLGFSFSICTPDRDRPSPDQSPNKDEEKKEQPKSERPDFDKGSRDIGTSHDVEGKPDTSKIG
jgi:hypothetical protein